MGTDRTEQVVDQYMPGIGRVALGDACDPQEFQEPSQWVQRLGTHGLGQLHDLRRVRNRDQCSAKLAQQRGDGHRRQCRGGGFGARHRVQEPGGNIHEQFLLGLHVPVQRPDLYVELPGQPAHGQVGQAKLREHADGGINELFTRQGHGSQSRRHSKQV